MANFAKNLAKGFVRSAVNQVGRDGGRVVSNQIYNGKNYVPVKNVGDEPLGAAPSSQTPPPPYTGTVDVSMEMPNVGFSSGKYVLFTLLCVLLWPIGTLITLIVGITQFGRTTAKITWEESEAQWAADKRYKMGARYLGHVTVKKSREVPAPPYIKEQYRRNGITLMLIAAVTGIAIGLVVWLS